MRFVQFLDHNGERRVGMAGAQLRILDGYERMYDVALEAIRSGAQLQSLEAHGPVVDYDAVVAEGRLLPPLDHRDPARTTVSLTGLTHLGSAESRDRMHALAGDQVTDSIRMFRIGLAGGKPAAGSAGAQPEWAYKGDGRAVVAPGHPLTQPAYAEDGGEEAEIAGLYLIDDNGNPWRVGFALGNEFADHVMERRNYLYLAHSKLRQCSYGPELLTGELPERVSGTIRIERKGVTVWSSPFESGEANMCHSIANLEHHHFKYEMFRRPGDVHVHFFGANGVSFGAGFETQDGDVFEVSAAGFGRPLRNALKVEAGLVSPAVRIL